MFFGRPTNILEERKIILGMHPKSLPGLKIEVAAFKTKYMLRTISRNLLNYISVKPSVEKIGLVT